MYCRELNHSHDNPRKPSFLPLIYIECLLEYFYQIVILYSGQRGVKVLLAYFLIVEKKINLTNERIVKIMNRKYMIFCCYYLVLLFYKGFKSDSSCIIITFSPWSSVYWIREVVFPISLDRKSKSIIMIVVGS